MQSDVLRDVADVNVIAFAGSLRKESYNKRLVEAAKKLAPDGMRIEAYDLAAIPIYNMDVEQSNFPAVVTEFKNRIRTSDGVIMAVPEHNYSFSGVIKNAIDWASRPYGDNAFDGKPVILQSASPGMMGGSRAQYHMRQVLGYLEMRPMQFPEVFVPFCRDKFDERGELTDERTSAQIQKQLTAFLGFITAQFALRSGA